MEIKSDIEIAQASDMQPIENIAQTLGIEKKDIELYGAYKAKVNYNIFKELTKRRTETNPRHGDYAYACGEGKTTTTIGLGDSLAKLETKR
jgi:formate--tetrahydrofolate ligase